MAEAGKLWAIKLANGEFDTSGLLGQDFIWTDRELAQRALNYLGGYFVKPFEAARVVPVQLVESK